MKKVLEGYTRKRVAEAIRIFRTVLAGGHTIEDFLSYEKENGEDRRAKIISQHEKRMKELGTIRGRRNERRKAGENRRRRPPAPFLKPGDSEVLSGVKCEKCGESVVSEALCATGAAKKGCIRIGICMGCGAEIKIR